MQPLLWRRSFDVLNQRKVKCKSVCRNVVNVSLYSKKQRAKPQKQLMSDLFEVQFYPPFTHTGVDCFSPIITKREIGQEPSQEQTKVTVLFLCA